MKIATLPADEELRLADLHSYNLMDTPFEKEYDDLVQLAAEICGCPMSLITLIDAERQWFKAKVGLDDTETSRSVAFCAHTILEDQTMVVENALEDERFHDNPMVSGDMNIRFYAGAPIVSPTGHKLGSICVIDRKPGKLNETQLHALAIISRQITKLIELRCKNDKLRRRATELIDLGSSTLQEVIKEKDKSDKVIAHELHEQVAQKIATSCLYMDMAEEESPLRTSYLQRGKELMGEVLKDVRKLSNSILPSSLESMPLKSLLKDFIQQAKTRYPFEIEMLVIGDTHASHAENNITCLRIIEKWLEILSNKESVSQVMISYKMNGRIDLKITDDSVQTGVTEMEEYVIRSQVYSRAKMAGGFASYSTKQEYENVLAVVI